MIGWMRGTQKKIEQLTLEAVAHSRESVWSCAQAQIQAMSVAEARGYTRARARTAVRHSVAAVLEQEAPLPPKAQGRVLANALEAVVEWVVERRQATPAVIRRAA